MSIFPRPLKKVLDKIVPFSQEDKVPLFNLGSGTYDATTVLRGDGVWATPPGLSGYVPYIGATQDVDLGIYKLTADAVEFSLTPTNAPGAGQIAYDGASGALSYLLNSSNVLSRIGQTMHAYVHNAEAVTITKGQAVYLFSASGNKASVKLANNTSDATSAKTFGLAAENIGANQNGMVICQGVLDGLNTGMYTAGDTLYLGSTPGGYTNVKPYAPNHFVYVGIVERANAGNGQIYVRVQNGYELDEIHDVDLITTPPINGNVLTYNGSLWVPQAPGGGGLTVGTTSIASGTVGRILFQNGGNVLGQDSSLFWDNTNKRLGVGATPASTVRLDVRAQGALSTDIAFRVRNSANTYNIFTIAGDGTVWSNGTGGGVYNTAFGEGALDARTTGNNNTAFGVYALSAVTTGNSNTAFGIYALLNNTGSSNTAVGSQAMQSCTSGGENTALGEGSLGNLTTGTNNVGIGGNLNSITTAFGNTALGRYAGVYLTSGNSNVLLGREAGARFGAGGTNLTTCGTSVIIGYDARTNGNSETNQIVIGNTAIGLGSNTAVIGNTSTTLFRPYGNVAIGADTANARLDVRAQGALSTDIAFRVRNSADTDNLIESAGNGLIKFRTGTERIEINTAIADYKISLYKFSLEMVKISTYSSYFCGNSSNQYLGIGNIAPSHLLDVNKSEAQNYILTRFGNDFNDTLQSDVTLKFTTRYTGGVSGGNPLAYLTVGNNGGVGVNNNCKSYFKFLLNRGNTLAERASITSQSNLLLQTPIEDTNDVGVIYIPNGTAPTTSITDGYKQYSADIVAGNAAPHFRTENGDIVKLYRVGGWGLPTGTFTRTTFDTATVTTAQLAERVAALIQDLRDNHQLLKA